VSITYEKAHEYLLNSYGNGKKKGLDIMRQALTLLGSPQEKLKIVHVAGTNGKGSVVAMLSSVLSETGYRTGAFTSPHLEIFNERLTINGQMISNEDFALYMADIIDISEQLFEKEDCFSYFEILTLLAFHYFKEKGVDILLLEVGIGGRLDATNVITKPILSIITAIGMDHMEILGDTIEKIAAEKGGIIKENCPVVLYDDQPVVYNILKDIAGSKNAEVYNAADFRLKPLEKDSSGTEYVADFKDFGQIFGKLGLAGDYQLQNAACVIAAASVLNQTDINISDIHLKNGLKNAKWPGRMESFETYPKIILEGAHNLQGTLAASNNIKELFGNKEITVVLGILNDKQYDEIVKILTAPASKVVFTKPNYDLRAVHPKDLVNCLDPISPPTEVHVEESSFNALKKAIEITDKDGVIFCVGSLYLVGDLRSYIINGKINLPSIIKE